MFSQTLTYPLKNEINDFDKNSYINFVDINSNIYFFYKNNLYNHRNFLLNNQIILQNSLILFEFNKNNMFHNSDIYENNDVIFSIIDRKNESIWQQDDNSLLFKNEKINLKNIQYSGDFTFMFIFDLKTTLNSNSNNNNSLMTIFSYEGNEYIYSFSLKYDKTHESKLIFTFDNQFFEFIININQIIFFSFIISNFYSLYKKIEIVYNNTILDTKYLMNSNKSIFFLKNIDLIINDNNECFKFYNFIFYKNVLNFDNILSYLFNFFFKNNINFIENIDYKILLNLNSLTFNDLIINENNILTLNNNIKFNIFNKNHIFLTDGLILFNRNSYFSYTYLNTFKKFVLPLTFYISFKSDNYLNELKIFYIYLITNDELELKIIKNDNNSSKYKICFFLNNNLLVAYEILDMEENIEILFTLKNNLEFLLKKNNNLTVKNNSLTIENNIYVSNYIKNFKILENSENLFVEKLILRNE